MSEIMFSCPYCNNEQFEEIEGMDEHDNYKAICLKCLKHFSYRVVFSVDGYTDKIDSEEEGK